MDKEVIKKFWESQGGKYRNVPFESLSNFEENQEVLNSRVDIEKKIVFSKINLNRSDTLLDLGAGVGQWAFRFANKVRKIVAVEYTESLVKIAIIEKEKRGFNNISYHHMSAEEYISEQKFDVIFISGLFIYLDDKQINKIVRNLASMIKEDTVIFLREPTSILEKRYLVNKYSESLKTNYSAVYRTIEEYRKIFKDLGYFCLEDGQFFPEGSDLNRFPETRLRYYLFKSV